jgi:4-diphosphocytidyl-2-C-methyl-D-erythritol kinase
MTADPLRRLSPVIRLAPAKINLTLAIVGRRPDGFHDLHSVFVPLAVADRLSLAVAAGAAGDTLHVDGTIPGDPAQNLVLRGIAAARQVVGGGWPGGPGPAPALAARLEKRLPISAGLGGGSSDGAAAVLGAIEAWAADVDDEAKRHALAMTGSDVPFFLADGPALVEGRGERVAPLHGLHGAPGVLLVTPAVHIGTPEVYAVYDGLHGGGGGDGSVRMTSAHLAEELRSGLTPPDLVARAGALASANDLLQAAILVEPGLVTVRRALMRLLGRPVGMSGSGPTLWTLYPSQSEAAEAAAVVSAAVLDGTIPSIGDGPPTVIATTIATGPAGRDQTPSPEARS